MKRIVLGGILVAFGLLNSPSFAQVKNAQIDRMVEALKQAAPPNRPNDGMYSHWQVLPGIIPSWTKQCTGKEMTPEQFDKDEKVARQVVTCIVAREMNNQYKTTKNETQVVKNVACWWMTGKTQGCDRGTTAAYVQKVVDFYQKQVKKDP